MEGTADDFLDLAEFCERVLCDEFLGFLVIKEGVANATNKNLLIPDYLKRLTRHGRFSDAERTAKQLSRDIDPNFYEKIIGYIQGNRSYQGSRYLNRGFIALSLQAATSGDKVAALRYLEKAHKIAVGIGTTDDVRCAEAEIALICGDFENANSIIKRLVWNDSTTDDTIFDLVRIHGALGQLDMSQALSERFAAKYQIADAQEAQYEQLGSPIEREFSSLEKENSKEKEISSPPELGKTEALQGKEVVQNPEADEINKSM
jgi:hypothetical protein